ncbi:hypothetical protein MTP99_016388 [Tenebrio molitor]|nr:hypothetical protein MTP99_016388 [Tenebrio molitor]
MIALSAPLVVSVLNRRDPAHRHSFDGTIAATRVGFAFLIPNRIFCSLFSIELDFESIERTSRSVSFSRAQDQPQITDRIADAEFPNAIIILPLLRAKA